MSVQADAAQARTVVRQRGRGDVDMLAQIYDRHVEVVYRYCCLRSGSRQTAGRLTSATFGHARQQLDAALLPGVNVGAWLLGLARQAAAEAGLRHDPAAVYDVTDSAQDLALLTALRRLSPDQQDCIVLRVLMGFSAAVVAQVIGRKTGYVGVLQYRALRSLARRLSEGFRP